MKKIIFILTFISLVYTSNYSQSSVWIINNKTNYLYLCGSIKNISATDYPLPKEFEDAYDNSEVVILEVNQGKLESHEIAEALIKVGTYKKNKTLKKALDSCTYKKLEQICSDLVTEINSLDKFKPSLAIQTLSTIYNQKLEIIAKGLEKHFYSLSIDDKKNLVYLETVKDRIKIIANAGRGNENKYIEYSLKDFNKNKNSVAGQIIDWRSGTTAFLSSNLKKMKKSFPKIYRETIVMQNNRWVTKLESHLKDTLIEFVLINNKHLVGPDGILKKLRNRGYSVKKYKP